MLPPPSFQHHFFYLVLRYHYFFAEAGTYYTAFFLCALRFRRLSVPARLTPPAVTTHVVFHLPAGKLSPVHAPGDGVVDEIDETPPSAPPRKRLKARKLEAAAAAAAAARAAATAPRRDQEDEEHEEGDRDDDGSATLTEAAMLPGLDLDLAIEREQQPRQRSDGDKVAAAQTTRAPALALTPARAPHAEMAGGGNGTSTKAADATSDAALPTAASSLCEGPATARVVPRPSSSTSCAIWRSAISAPAVVARAEGAHEATESGSGAVREPSPLQASRSIDVGVPQGGMRFWSGRSGRARGEERKEGEEEKEAEEGEDGEEDNGKMESTLGGDEPHETCAGAREGNVPLSSRNERASPRTSALLADGFPDKELAPPLLVGALAGGSEAKDVKAPLPGAAGVSCGGAEKARVRRERAAELTARRRWNTVSLERSRYNLTKKNKKLKRVSVCVACCSSLYGTNNSASGGIFFVLRYGKCRIIGGVR